MKQMMMMVLACSTVSVLAADGSVQFVECPKCDKRMRISEDGREAFVNLSRIDPERKAERYGEVPLGRLATAEDVANAVLYLASEEASFINGVSLPVDGGVTCY